MTQHAPLGDHLLIATAGHVDHGKSTLVRTLTGTDPDRWVEEKQRGITIDLGFAHVDAPASDGSDTRRYAFVDVPGHEKFVHNMLAGIGSIDAVLFVIAADESIMPQTREHARALQFLGVDQVCLVFTKVDLVSEDLLELLNEEVDEWLDELGWRPLARANFSSKQSASVESVMAALAQLNKRPAAEGNAFRMAVDRVFTSAGSGTVVTGTVDRGCLEREQSLRLSPSGQQARVRQLQQHGETVDHVGPRARAAVNLGGIHHTSIGRGECLFNEPAPMPSHRVLVRLFDFEEGWQPGPKHVFHIHHLSAKCSTRLRWRDGDFALLELRDNHPLWALDRGLIRDGTPLRLCAGFQVLHPAPPHVRRARVLPSLEQLPATLDLASWQAWLLTQTIRPLHREDLRAWCGEDLLPQLVASSVTLDGDCFMSVPAWQSACESFLAGLKALHQRLPLYGNVPLSSARAEMERFSEVLWQAVWQWALRTEAVTGEGDRLRLAGWQASWSEKERERCRQVLDLVDAKTGFLDRKALEKFRDLEKLLIWEGYLVAISRDLCILSEKIGAISEHLHGRFQGGTFSIAELKETFGLTRKSAIPLLEFFDKSGWTRRVGDQREWIAAEAPCFTGAWRPPFS